MLGRKPIDVYVGRRLSELRFARRLELATLAAYLEVDVDELAAFETGHKPLDPETLTRISGILNVQPSWFVRDFRAG